MWVNNSWHSWRWITYANWHMCTLLLFYFTSHANILLLHVQKLHMSIVGHMYAQ